MNFPFYKYQGTGNDFIIINHFSEQFFSVDDSFIKSIPELCERKWGVGADGIILIEKSTISDFKMTFFNPDGSLSFCGNGARSAIKFSYDMGICKSSSTIFEANDGLHTGKVLQNDFIELSMSDVMGTEEVFKGCFINTGAPHFVRKIDENINDFNLIENAFKIRWDKYFEPVGTNVNYINEISENKISIRTFEKGVEAETLSCGTGVTAAALYYILEFSDDRYEVDVLSKGGALKVIATKKSNIFTDIKLVGKVGKVFKGEIGFEQVD